MTPSEIEMAKINKDRDIAREHESREDARQRKGNITKLIGGIPQALKVFGKGLNDPSWYKQYQGLEGVNTTIPDYTPGDQVDLSLRSVLDGNPSVFKLLYIPTIGQVEDSEIASSGAIVFKGVSEANTAIARIRAQLGKRNSIALNVSKDTFGRYMVAVVDGLLVPMKRLKTAIDVYTVANAFYPELSEKLITALGFNYGEFSDYIQVARDKYNKWANKINESVPMVKSCTLVSRRLFLCGLILKDRDDMRNQNVVCAPIADAYLRSTDDVIRYCPISNISVRTFIDMIASNFKLITDGATWKQVIRLFLNGFAESEFYKLPVSPDVISSGAVFSSEMLSQIHNMRSMPFIKSAEYGYDGSNLYMGQLIGDSLCIGGDPSENMIQGIVSSGKTIPTMFSTILPTQGICAVRRSSNSSVITAMSYALLYSNNRNYEKTILNFFSKPTADDYLVGTRLTTKWKTTFVSLTGGIPSSVGLNLDGFSGDRSFSSETYCSIFPVLYGTEIPMGLFVVDSTDIVLSYNSTRVVFDPSTDKWNDQDAGDGLCTSEFYTGTTINGYAAKYSRYTSIDWLPLVRVGFGQSSSSSGTYFTLGELSHYTEAPDDSLAKLHGQAILSEFSIAADKFLPPLK